MGKQMEKNQLKQAENQNQQGRSMVEMLGVLAIIGVLSIGGIAGYRWAMDKHMANQVLYEMNLNSAQLAMLLQKGNSHGITLSLGSPYDDNKTFKTIDYGFEYGCGDSTSLGHECQNQNETVYYIKATGIPEKVCNILDEAVFSMPYYYDSEINGDKGACQAEDNTVAVLFDVNYSNKDEDSDSEVATTTLKPTRPPHEITTATPIATTLTTNAATTLTTQSPTTLTTNAATTLTTQSLTTVTPIATTVTTFTTLSHECTDNADCQALKGSNDYYCKSSECDGCNGNTIEEKCSSYKCEPISYASKEIGTTTYYKSPADMNWWSAKRYCDALKTQGKAKNGMVSKEELTKYDGANGALCSKLKEKGWANWVWTSTPKGGSDETSCYAYYVSLGSGGILSGDRCGVRGFYYALCK